MHPSKLIILSLMASGLAACATTSSPPPVITNKTAPITMPTVAPMDLQQVHWIVRDVNGLKVLIQQVEASGQKDAVFYVLSRDQYEVLAMNLSEVKRYVADERVANEFIKAAIEINNKSLAEPPKAAPAPKKKKFGIF